MTPDVDKLHVALAAGQLWRAKEILSGRIASAPFDQHTYEQYGRLLLRMGDDLSAGRYLFLSGARQPEYAAAIELFLRRHGRAGWRGLVASFPASARRAGWGKLPVALQEDLRTAGVPARGDTQTVAGVLERSPAPPPSSFGCLLVLIGLLAVGLMVSVLIVYGYEWLGGTW